MAFAAGLCAYLLAFHLCLAHTTARDLSGKSTRYQTMIVGETAPARLAQSEQVEGKGAWSVEIVHRDGLPAFRAKATTTEQEVLQERLKRDAARVEAINMRARLAAADVNPTELKPAESTSQVSAEDFSTPIVSGLRQGSGEYFARFGIGTPPRQAYFVLDTGSDLSWTQCQPCQSCYKQSDPVFNPAASSSFQSVTCSSPLCGELQISACQRNLCLYQVSYGDGSFTVGNFALETFTFGGNTVKDVGIGCGHDNEGLFVGASGLLGLGAGKLSFPSQIRSEFSYCLADRLTGGASALIFGAGAVPGGAKLTPLLTNARLSTFYYVGLEGISVGGSALSLSPSDFSIQPSGDGGVIVDSGTSVTRLVASAYPPLRDAFRALTNNLPLAGSFSLFDTCYSLGGAQSVEVPTVDLHFAGGATLALPAANYLIPIDTVGTYCFAFASSSSSLSIIGNLQQQGFRVSFNSQARQVGFTPNQC